MHRLRKFALAALVALTITACDEGEPPITDIPPPPPSVGTISGTVTIDGTGATGITATLSSGATTATGAGGTFSFADVEAGSYTVTISGYPADAAFPSATQAATIASDGQTVQLNFAGEYIRSSSVVGSVGAADPMMMGSGSSGDGRPDMLDGITVTLEGEHAMAEPQRTMEGGFAFTGLRGGSYTVTISDTPEDVHFETLSMTVEVELGDVGMADFEGAYIRTAAVEGQVIIDGEGLPGVTVTLTGGPGNDNYTKLTGADGEYAFGELRPGDYQVSISGYDPDDFEFASSVQDVSVELEETETVSFTGTLLRTSGISGRVSVGGMGIPGVTVTLSGVDAQTAMTNASGQYAIAGLAAGDYTVTISGYDAVEYSFEASQAVTLEMDATAIVNFAGAPLRTASIAVMVTADGEGVAGASATLIQVTGPTSGTVLGIAPTGADGGYTFGPLLAGVYRVDISVNSDEIDFTSTSWQGPVATGMTAEANFAGTINKTASISGSVTVDGEGMPGVTVTLSGGADDSMETGDDGSYGFGDLRKGAYTVSITNPDEARYAFDGTSRSVSLAVGQAQSVSFTGSMVRTSSISGRVGINDGTGLPGVTVTLSGAKDDEATTGVGGVYAFTELGEGDYTVTISGYDAVEYSFEASQAVTLGLDAKEVVNFDGRSLRTASVAVMVTADGEGVAGASATLIQVTGPTSGTVLDIAPTDADGGHTFGSLLAGAYRVEISVDSDEIDFETLSWQGLVATDSVAEANFPGTINRTAIISGSVTIDGEGESGVMVTLSGAAADSMVTEGDDGSYSFGELRKGEYTVSITNPDENRYEFTGGTSESVSLAVGQIQSVSFPGAMVRSSTITGRVGLNDGTGVEGVMVTLSGAAAKQDTTDAGGVYTFAKLGAGDYTVAMTLSDEDAVKYVFHADSTSQDVTLGDDDHPTVNFNGAHATTAMVSGTLFVDELGVPNGDLDEGENALPQTGVSVRLTGPGNNDHVTVITDDTGYFEILERRAGPYRLVVTVPDAVAMTLGDYAYDGPPTGYEFDVAVGEEKTQDIPFRITHTTVNFEVRLKQGESPLGDSIPGATVNLYTDPAGANDLKSAETGDDGKAELRIDRDDVAGNTVYADVSSDDYEVVGGIEAVIWDAQMTSHEASNDGDIVNLNVDATFSGATITNDAGAGGDALVDWLVDVTSGDDAVEGEGVPDKLDEDGDAGFTTTVGVDDLPASFTFAVADDQTDKDADGNELDGGEMYKVTPVEYEHTGRKLAATMYAGPIKVEYTTQTLIAYVHEELDQVFGYTGNILNGDARDVVGVIDVGIRYIDPSSGRSRTFAEDDWDKDENTDDDDGVWTFSHVPADADVIVQASKADDASNHMLLDKDGHSDELATYRDLVTNGVTDGAFGDMGGYSHTVSLCSLQATDPTDQDYDKCASFAYVNTHSVKGLVWKNEVLLSDESANDDFFLMGPKDDEGPTFVADISVDLDPTAGKNIAGDQESFETLEANDKSTKRPDGEDFLDTHQFDFGYIAAGVYELSVSPGWRARMGKMDAPDDALVGKAFNPLALDVELDVTPATTTVYGYVRDADEFPVEDVIVTVNGVEAPPTDEHGRYIAEYVGSETRKIGADTHSKRIFVETNHEENEATLTYEEPFAPNSRINVDVALGGLGRAVSYSGTVTAAGSGDPIAGAQILVDHGDGAIAPTNPNAKSPGVSKNDIYLTDGEGEFTVQVDAGEIGDYVELSVTRTRMNFVPPTLRVPAHQGFDGIIFTGFLHATITGRVRNPDGSALGDVTVTATNVVDKIPTPVKSTSNARGTFRLSVPFGSYQISAELENYTFDYPPTNPVSVTHGQILDFGIIQSMSPAASNIDATRARTPDDPDTGDVDESERSYDGNITVTFDANDMDVPEDYGMATYEVRHNGTAADGMFPPTGGVVAAAALTADDPQVEIPGKWTASFTSPTAEEFQVQVVATATSDVSGNLNVVITSAAVTVDAVDPTASGVTAERGVNDDDLETLDVAWTAVTNMASSHRVVIQVDHSGIEALVWLVAPTSGDVGTEIAADGTTRAWVMTLPEAPAEGAVDPLVSGWNYATSGLSAPNVPRADLLKALDVAVESLQGTFNADDNPWTRSDEVTVEAKPDDS